METIPLNIAAVEAELCRREFYFFVQTFWDKIIAEKPVWNWHIKYLCDEAERVVRQIADRKPKDEDVIVNIPPGTSKSTIFSVMLPAWAWVIDPSIKIITVSYSGTLARELSVKSRNIIESDRFRLYFPEIQLKHDKNMTTNYENTKLGQRFASGLHGTGTGMHGHLIIIDDPLNPNEAASDTERESANKTIDNTWSTRKVDNEVAVTMLIMQRLAEDDPTGHLLEKRKDGKKFKHFRFPAELVDEPLPASVRKFYKNGLFDPIRKTLKALKELKADLGSYGAAGQLAQQPAPKKGAIWGKWFRAVPDHLFPDVKRMSRFGTDWDLAYTDKDENAASAYVSAGKIGNNIYIADIGWDWLEFAPLIRYMKSRPGPHYIEAKGPGKSAKQTLSKNGVPAIEVKVDGGDKVARARMATPQAEAGMVFIRASLIDSLYNDSKQGILKFPKGKYKDLADALAQCLQRLKKGGWTVSGPSGSTGSKVDIDDIDFDDLT